jgi:hypothetical protein
VVFGPLAGKSNGMEIQDLLPRVCRIAGRLAEDLTRAEQLTGGWKNEPLGQALLDASLSQSLDQLAATGCRGEDNRLPSSELWRIAGTMLQQGSMQYHARIKPRGYAGDYLMLLRIYRHYRCDDPLGRLFDGYFQRQAAPHAVRARTEQVAAATAWHCLRARPGAYQVVSVGSGPALDLHQALTILPESRRATLRVTLVDVDPDALDLARQQLGPLLPPAGLACVRTNLSRLPQPAHAEALPERAELLICTGLFDYLDQDSAVAMLRLFWQRLAPGGLLLVGNFAPHNPSRTYMEWIGLWYLNYRTPEEMEQLGLSAGIPRDSLAIGCDRTGLDLFLRAWKSER